VSCGFGRDRSLGAMMTSVSVDNRTALARDDESGE